MTKAAIGCCSCTNPSLCICPIISGVCYLNGKCVNLTQEDLAKNKVASGERDNECHYSGWESSSGIFTSFDGILIKNLILSL